MTEPTTLYLVVTGAPLARRIEDAADQAVTRGLTPVVIATEAVLESVRRPFDLLRLETPDQSPR